MTRKHYEAIAKAINNATTYDAYGDEIVHKDDLIDDLSIVFKSHNSLFNKQRFVDACNDNL